MKNKDGNTKTAPFNLPESQLNTIPRSPAHHKAVTQGKVFVTYVTKRFSVRVVVIGLEMLQQRGYSRSVRVVYPFRIQPFIFWSVNQTDMPFFLDVFRDRLIYTHCLNDAFTICIKSGTLRHKSLKLREEKFIEFV